MLWHSKGFLINFNQKLYGSYIYGHAPPINERIHIDSMKEITLLPVVDAGHKGCTAFAELINIIF